MVILLGGNSTFGKPPRRPSSHCCPSFFSPRGRAYKEAPPPPKISEDEPVCIGEDGLSDTPVPGPDPAGLLICSGFGFQRTTNRLGNTKTHLGPSPPPNPLQPVNIPKCTDLGRGVQKKPQPG